MDRYALRTQKAGLPLTAYTPIRKQDIQQDPPKSLFTRRVDKVQQSIDMLTLVDQSGDRISTSIRQYPKGINPFKNVNYNNAKGKQAKLPYVFMNTAFRPPLMDARELFPISNQPRLSVQTSPVNTRFYEYQTAQTKNELENNSGIRKYLNVLPTSKTENGHYAAAVYNIPSTQVQERATITEDVLRHAISSTPPIENIRAAVRQSKMATIRNTPSKVPKMSQSVPVTDVYGNIQGYTKPNIHNSMSSVLRRNVPMIKNAYSTSAGIKPILGPNETTLSPNYIKEFAPYENAVANSNAGKIKIADRINTPPYVGGIRQYNTFYDLQTNPQIPSANNIYRING